MMRKATIFFTVSLMFALLFNGALAQDHEQERRFPSLPAHPFKPPTAEQRGVWTAFRNTHPDWQIRWSKKTGVPRSLLGLPIEIVRGTPEKIARQFLLQNRILFKMKENLSQLTLRKIERRRATHVIFQQTYAGIPVWEGVYGIHMTREGKVYLASSEYFDDVKVQDTSPKLSLTDAVQVAKGDLGPDLLLRETPTGELVILPYGSEFRLAWKVTVPATAPMGLWIYFISASDGSILTGYNSADFVTRSGDVYDRHPEAGPVVNRPLTNLSGNGYFLDGTFVEVLNAVTSEADWRGSNFEYDPNNTHFDEVMVYYHINRFQDEYLDDVLGYPYLDYPNTLRKVIASVHALSPYDSPVATPPNLIDFGDGDGTTRNDWVKEDDVIYHEYLHLVTHYITTSGLDAPGNNYDQTDAMDEAFSDYFAG